MNLAAHGEPNPFGPREVSCPDVIPIHRHPDAGFAASHAWLLAPTSDVNGVTP